MIHIDIYHSNITMKLIFFLGNPWPQYEQTRHNMWFLVGDILANDRNCPNRSHDKKSNSLITTTKFKEEKIILIKPQSFINLSGQAVLSLRIFYKLDNQDIIIVHDDLDLPLETIRIRHEGSAGWHNGLKDIIQRLGTDKFMRVKIGIGRPLTHCIDIVDHVLGKLSDSTIDRLGALSKEVEKEIHNYITQ